MGSLVSIEQTDTIDFVTVDKASDGVLLTISDHLDWDETEGQHLVLLQRKLNAYLRFIESRELYEKFPETSERPVVIQITSKFPMSKKAELFYERAASAIHNAGFKLTFKLFHPN
jgi:hypothetical protein